MDPYIKVLRMSLFPALSLADLELLADYVRHRPRELLSELDQAVGERKQFSPQKEMSQ